MCQPQGRQREAAPVGPAVWSPHGWLGCDAGAGAGPGQLWGEGLEGPEEPQEVSRRLSQGPGEMELGWRGRSPWALGTEAQGVWLGQCEWGNLTSDRQRAPGIGGDMIILGLVSLHLSLLGCPADMENVLWQTVDWPPTPGSPPTVFPSQQGASALLAAQAPPPSGSREGARMRGSPRAMGWGSRSHQRGRGDQGGGLPPCVGGPLWLPLGLCAVGCLSLQCELSPSCILSLPLLPSLPFIPFAMFQALF